MENMLKEEEKNDSHNLANNVKKSKNEKLKQNTPFQSVTKVTYFSIFNLKYVTFETIFKNFGFL